MTDSTFPGATPRLYESGEAAQVGDIVMIDSVAVAEYRGLEAGEHYRVVEFNQLGNLVVVPLNAGGDNQGHGSLRFRLVSRAATPTALDALRTERDALKDEVQRLQSIKRLLLYVLKGLLDVETDDWVKAQAATAISNAELIDNGTYRPGVFMPTGSEEVAK